MREVIIVLNIDGVTLTATEFAEKVKRRLAPYKVKRIIIDGKDGDQSVHQIRTAHPKA